MHSVTTIHKRRSTPKPTVEISVEKAKQIIHRAKITVKEGEVYAIYHCGHVFANSEDPQILTYYMGENRSIRSCPICVSQKLVTKYKLCGCGAEHLGKRVQPSYCCSKCSSLRKTTGRNERLDEYKRNMHLYDPTRLHCVYRAECLDTYREYDTIPCKDCPRYILKQGNRDPIYTK